MLLLCSFMPVTHARSPARLHTLSARHAASVDANSMACQGIGRIYRLFDTSYLAERNQFVSSYSPSGCFIGRRERTLNPRGTKCKSVYASWSHVADTSLGYDYSGVTSLRRMKIVFFRKCDERKSSCKHHMTHQLRGSDVNWSAQSRGRRCRARHAPPVPATRHDAETRRFFVSLSPR